MATFVRHATVSWAGAGLHGEGSVTAGTSAFQVPVSFPRVAGEPPGRTTPEEMLAASHAICFGIGLRSVIGQRGGAARSVQVTATITADKGPDGIRIRASLLKALVDGLEGIDPALLPEIGRATEEGCTISIAIRGTVAISHEVALAPADATPSPSSSSPPQELPSREA